ncbi:G2-specific serine/threonine protein kinase [Orbilia oligospora]|uniref:non-specific serine/threonine protein kinase n=2 Tax=Orbilia oligospora TaxID=2813651 RepID=A0A7C8JNX3_ORBOL|nr:G2-specific serine/threonine protein kinase [Orbilia oligospora]KAF3093094.1 G2-specific serine/threonine protein kinase [Orbilia oligospora]KAF3108381.1 G2-specific serine/threonine protein kinase [Orbilia oligospora]KAF3122602.1 G2-specific serine/threonine protein kinase [Orbilia oligospora]KAF3127693.1 G2-specific serine/threonine protein kinase [Orbilia oligospora]
MGEDYEILELIGRGSFGQIHKVRRIRDGLILARKEISYNRMSAKEKEQLTAEFSILSKLQHPNIVRYFNREHNKTDQSLYIYMEYCGGGDLSTHIKRCKSNGTLVPEHVVWSIFTQLVLALYKCHHGSDPPALEDMNEGWDKKKKAGSTVTTSIPAAGSAKASREVIVHRDLKPENVFLDHDTCVKLGDFGLSRILASDQHMATTYVGTPYYMSPEIVCDLPYTSRSDIWSLGCVIYELCALSPPFDAKSLPSLCQKIQAGRYSPIPSSYSPELRRVVDLCLRTNPSDRPDTAKLLDLQIIRTIRRELDALEISRSLKIREDSLRRREKELEVAEKSMNKILEDAASRMRAEIDAELRKVWDEKAEEEIRRRVDLEVTRRCADHDTDMKRQYHEALEAMRGEFRSVFEKQVKEEVQKRVADELLSSKISVLDVAERDARSGSIHGIQLGSTGSPLEALEPGSQIGCSRSLGDPQATHPKPEDVCPASPMDISASPAPALDSAAHRRMHTQQQSPTRRRNTSGSQSVTGGSNTAFPETEDVYSDDDEEDERDEPSALQNPLSRPIFVTSNTTPAGVSRQGLSRVYSAPINQNPQMPNPANPSTPPRGRRTSSGHGMLKPNPGAENRQLSPTRRLFASNFDVVPESKKNNIGAKAAAMNNARGKSIVTLQKEKKEKENSHDPVAVWDPETEPDMPSPFKKNNLY